MIDLNTTVLMLGLVTGMVMALSGAGGSIFAIPMLVFGLNLSLLQAAPIALLAVMASATVGALQGLKQGNVRYKAALVISGFGLLMAPVGVWLAQRAPTEILSAILAVIMVYIAWRMWVQNESNDPKNKIEATAPCEINPATSKLFWTAFCTKRLVATGAIAGLLSGLLGVGGGFVIVPSLRKVSNFDFQTIIATSLAVIALVSAGSVLMYILHGHIDWVIAIPFVLATMLSMLVFRLISHKIPTIISQRCFAVFAVVSAILMLLKTAA